MKLFITGCLKLRRRIIQGGRKVEAHKVYVTKEHI
jgi:hypothetical protein